MPIDANTGPTQNVHRRSAGAAVAGHTPPARPVDDTDLPPTSANPSARTGPHGTHALRSAPLVTSSDKYPKPGGQFGGFDVLTELGRGGMGRVFLARQPAMGSRTVVLKVGEHLSAECQKLAKLQHPNVVPVHSFHQQGTLQAVCMPYRGPLTLAHLISQLQNENIPTLNGRALTTVIDACRRSREQSISISPTGPQAEPIPQPALPEVKPGTRLFDGLRGMNFVDAILTLVRQVAEGLRFAHGEKIVHSDLKPANVLIADDGSPQLIDFGIAYDQSNPSTKGLVIGGTRPYSSPEQLSSLAHAAVEYDERSDLYSVGVMLYEMVTGRLPFAPNYDASEQAIELDRKGRFTPPPSPRSVNPRVPVAVESIIGKCLAPTAADRYQSASQLLDDIDRQLARRPLRHAPNPSRRELASKWVRRNRWLVAAGLVLAAGGAMIGGFGLHSARQNERLVSAEAITDADRFDLDSRRAQAALSLGATDVRGWEAAIRSGEQVLAPYRVLDEERWWESGPATKLSPQRITQLRERVALLLIDLSRAAGVRGTLVGVLADRGRWMTKAQDWNRRAELAFPGDATPRGVWTQRAWLARLVKDQPAAADATRAASAIPLRTAVDYRIEGRELMEQGKWREANDLLAKAVELDPTDFWASFASGQIHYRMGYDALAVTAYDVCAALDPAVPGVYFNRGLAHLRLRQFQKAEDDFTRVIAAKGDWADPYLNRATAREALNQFPESAADLTKAIDLGYPPTAVLLARSRVHSLMGKDDLAKRDLDEGMKGTPTDERGWITRGYARLPKDATGGLKAFKDSLADFDQALALNPRSATALQSKARVYSRTNENRLAVDTLTELLGYYPETLDALSGRAMLYSRLGEREKAHADAEEAVRLSGDNPRTVYQIAGVYAMTSQTNPDDKREAFRHLASSLRKGYGFDLLDKDRELDPLRSDPEFSQVVEDARRVVERPTKK